MIFLKQTKAFFIKVIALCLAFSLAAPATAYAARAETVMPLGSDYLGSYQVMVEPMGNGEIQVWFIVTGVKTLDEIGALSVKLYESTDNTNWTRVETYLHEDCPGMLAYNDFIHGSYVSYQGTAGKYYKAFVCIWGGEDGLGDRRYVWTNPALAT